MEHDVDLHAGEAPLPVEDLHERLSGKDAVVVLLPDRMDRAAIDAWTQSDDGKAFMRASGEAWAEAHIASGEAPDDARAMAGRTIAFYTGA